MQPETDEQGDVAQLVEAAVSEAARCGFDSHRHHLHAGRSSAEGHDLGSPVRVRGVRLYCRRAGVRAGLISPLAGFDSQVCNSFPARNEPPASRAAPRLISVATGFDSWAGDCDRERGRVPQLVEGSGREPDCCGFDSHPGHFSGVRRQEAKGRKQKAGSRKQRGAWSRWSRRLSCKQKIRVRLPAVPVIGLVVQREDAAAAWRRSGFDSRRVHSATTEGTASGSATSLGK